MARSLKKGPYVFDRLLKRVRELNKSGKKEPKYYHHIWPFINRTYGILYKLFTKSGLGQYECCDEMFDFNTVNSLKLPKLFPSLTDDCFEDCVSMVINEKYELEFITALNGVLSFSPISTIAFLCRGQSCDKEIVLGTLSYSDFVSMLYSGNVQTNICYIITGKQDDETQSGGSKLRGRLARNPKLKTGSLF